MVVFGIGWVVDLCFDMIYVVELGICKDCCGLIGIVGFVGLLFSGWWYIQVDLVDWVGFLFFVNIGNSLICGVEVDLNWVFLIGLQIDVVMFLNDMWIIDFDLIVWIVGVCLLNMLFFVLFVLVCYDWSLGQGCSVGIDGGWCYVG